MATLQFKNSVNRSRFRRGVPLIALAVALSANWTPNTGYPGGTGITDVATFDVSNTTAVSIC